MLISKFKDLFKIVVKKVLKIKIEELVIITKLIANKVYKIL